MSNNTYTHLAKMQPLLHVVGSSFAALSNADNVYSPDLQSIHSHSSSNGMNVSIGSNNNDNNNNHSSDILVLYDQENYTYRSTSTIVLMVTAWILLILGFVFCCCAECFGVSVWRGKKRASISLSGAESGAASAGNGNQPSQLHADRANHGESTIDVCRHCPPEYEAESLPSYTIVSGLPTYDDALEEFRKAGIILTPAFVPVIKIFENVNNETGGAKEPAVSYSLVESTAADVNVDNISITSITCNCGGSSPTGSLPSYSAATAAAMAAAGASGSQLTSQVIELSPEHLASLSEKRLSLQISFNNSLRRRSRSTLRNHLLRSRAVGNTAGLGPIETTMPNVTIATGTAPGPARDSDVLPSIHRSSSSVSLSSERQLLDQRLRHLHHRGSLY
ncbi:protein commissureless 2 homolog isoform X2 [Drosophila hydei]|uniref:Protein commissureless 2 homolog isoform X2 n=1 Tax=Drosophila hydei TaxID=7224 RepID=A0A6J1LUL6_DROHY|nr:protein commissureless 2 homolog isoform X2 [Drosophila hydei]